MSSNFFCTYKFLEIKRLQHHVFTLIDLVARADCANLGGSDRSDVYVAELARELRVKGTAMFTLGHRLLLEDWTHS